MKRTLPVLVALAVGCATGAVVRDIVAPARAQGQVGPSYEYEAVSVPSDVGQEKQTLARYGHEGWRLVAATQESAWHTLFFERQLPR